MSLAVPLSRFASQMRRGSAFFVRPLGMTGVLIIGVAIAYNGYRLKKSGGDVRKARACLVGGALICVLGIIGALLK